MAKRKTKFVCQHCGYESPKWMGKCPGCSSWNSFVEEMEASGNRNKHTFNVGRNVAHKPEKISSIQTQQEPRVTVEMREFNRVLGGGIVAGSLVLIGGDPGIGKSTLLLQISAQLADKELPVLYVSGEESIRQTKLRADRLDITSDLLYVLSETNLFDIAKQVEEIKPSFVVIDSIQTMYKEAARSPTFPTNWPCRF
jgi:DNA repair protein RadA/Sms